MKSAWCCSFSPALAATEIVGVAVGAQPDDANGVTRFDGRFDASTVMSAVRDAPCSQCTDHPFVKIASGGERPSKISA